ncbi:uncharacterized protein K489DRAFT_412467 [Dissoconium aciculare CBS 342.82]|uniref:DNA damage-binding protein 1 n=1 Tax=Dissoconium aciculare CBS 342.82 TaxID=1314786 RepID=A0A6J3LVH8_9PEZI|nr:uncharacterized protein K489DRAFT_412467 [Dissoconium aciculare CBS 342.82]KAF1819766.1 hypothetical protein K489DRAFT_412467 [Dissoconium aciculare CBS 342.82]
MANIQQTQAFYALTLEQSSAPTAAVVCSVIPGEKNEQIFEARGQRVLLHRVIDTTVAGRRVETIAEHDVFGIVRRVAAFRVPGTSTDQLVVATDSGRVTVLDFDSEKMKFRRIHLETFGKSGIRRTVPGQYLAVDPRGRCLMLASAEKNKVVYFLTRQGENEILISSPHEANKWACLCFDICALDTYWDQPIFAALEVDYTQADTDSTGLAYERREKHLVYYTVDLGLNHVVKSWSDPVDYSAHKLFAVPGGQDGPSGVLVCAEGRIYYRHNTQASMSIAIPRRKGLTEDQTRDRCIVAGCLHVKRSTHTFFFLLQTDDGDVFRLDIVGEDPAVPEYMHLKYYDTFPVARQMVLHKRGFLYILAENGCSKLMHIDDLAQDLEYEPHNNFSSEGVSPDPTEKIEPTFFQPRELTMCSLSMEVPGSHPLIKAKVANLTNEDAPQIYTLQGSGTRSRLQTMRYGITVEEPIQNPMGNVPYDNLFPMKHRATDQYHSYLLITSQYAQMTVACSITDSVEQLEDSGFMENRATIHANQMGDATRIQVHARGIRSILESGAVNDWETPKHTTIVAASSNSHQMLIGLSSGELVYFMMDEDGVLQQLEDMPEMDDKITSLAVGTTPPGRQQAKFAVVGCADSTIRVISIETSSLLEVRTVQALSAIPTSLELIEMIDANSKTMVTNVHIGLESGLYLRAVLDELTGELGDTRTKFIGTRSPRLCPVRLHDQDCIVACSSRPWLAYNHPQSRLFTLTPLVTEGYFEAARTFNTPFQNSGLCAIQGSNLLIFEITSINERLSTTSVDLKYTPRAFDRSPYFPVWYVVQSDANTLSEATRAQLRGGSIEDDEAATALEKHLGVSHGTDHWASCIQAVDPVYRKAVTTTIELGENEAALCCAVVQFEEKNWDHYLAVGTGQHMSPGTNKTSAGFIHIYHITEDGTKLDLVHKTDVASPVYALMAFKGRLAAGIGKDLVIYDIGMKKLLRKSRGVNAAPNQIVTLEASGNRIICGDVCESVTYVVFKPKFNRLIPFVDDTVKRWTTASAMMDYETVAGGDKFGNLWVVRCPPQASQEADEDNATAHLMNERSYLHGTPYRLDLRAHYYAQDIPVSMQKTALVAGGQDVLFWAGLQGTLGILVPFIAREDVDFFTSLQQGMRAEDPPLAGRDHLAYRSYYLPVKGAIDGDLCERFMALSYDGKQKVAAETERSVAECEKKIQEMRTRVAF